MNGRELAALSTDKMTNLATHYRQHVFAGWRHSSVRAVDTHPPIIAAMPLIKRAKTFRVLLSALLAVACTLIAKLALADESRAVREISSPPAVVAVSDVVFKAVSMIGTRYQRGGQTPDAGFDCSGFVRYVFAQTLQRELPRTSAEMSALGEQIAREQLQPGDLVFYNTLKRAFSHVGIYIGEGRFVHAPSRGRHVEIVDMADRYWQRRFNGARRLVEPRGEPAAEMNTEATAPQTESAR